MTREVNRSNRDTGEEMKNTLKLLGGIGAVLVAAIVFHSRAVSASPAARDHSNDTQICGNVCNPRATPNPCVSSCGANSFCEQLPGGGLAGRCVAE
jgi:hypothetical protein